MYFMHMEKQSKAGCQEMLNAILHMLPAKSQLHVLHNTPKTLCTLLTQAALKFLKE